MHVYRMSGTNRKNGMGSISKMLSYRNGHAVVLALVSMQSLVFGSTFDERNRTRVWDEAIVSSMKVLWMNGMESVMNSSGSACAKEIEALSEAIDAEEKWALEMLDSSSKIQSGILQGNMVDLGMYGQCAAVHGKYNEIDVRGKHCMVTLGLENLTLTLSACIPSSCNETHAIPIASSPMKHFLANSSSETEIETIAVTCARTESQVFTLGEILTIAFFLTVGGFLLVCTMCDFVKRSWPEKKFPFTLNTLAKFSLYTSALAILSTEVKPGTMLAINGIRFLSTCWVVVWHRYLYSMVQPLINPTEYWEWFSTWNSVWSEMSTFATDNFFMISGFLMSYLFFKSMRSGGKFDLPMMYLHRYVRLTPAVAVVTLFITVLFHRIGNGPLWRTLSPTLIDNCRENWWVNLLYLQNILRPTKICLEWSWFLAADMQLFWISPIILYPLHRWPKYGLGILTLFILASVVASTIIVGFKGYVIVARVFDSKLEIGRLNFQTTVMSLLREDFREVFFDYYIQAHTRAFPYLLGIFLGYEIATKKRHLSQMAVVFNWIATCLLMISCLIATHHLFRVDIEDYPAFLTTCAALLRPFWSIAMAWIIYACTQGHGGVIGRFLSLPIFLPLSRLSYGIYLVHLIISTFRIGTTVKPAIFLDSEILNSYVGDLVVAIGVSAVISLFFEWPVMVLEKILKDSSRQRRRATPTQGA